MPGSINLSLLYAGHANDLHIKTACDPPRTFRHASICPRIDRQASGLILLTPRIINTPSHTLRLRTCWFPFGSFLLRINLRQQNKLFGPFYKTYVMTPAFKPVLPHHCGVLRLKDPFAP